MAAISIFDVRTMLEALEEIKEPNTFLMKKFFSNRVECATESVDIDIMKGTRRVPAYVNPRSEGQVIDRAGFSTYTYKPPYLKPKMVTTAEDILKRQPGEVLYGRKTNEQAASQQLGKDLKELDAIIQRAEELQAVQALLDATVQVLDIDGHEVVADISYPRDAALTIDLTATGETPWDSTGSDQLADLRSWRRLILQKSGMSADIAVMGSDAADILVSSSTLRAALDNRYADVGRIVMEAQELGVVYIGRFEGIDCYEYDEWYINPATGTEGALFDSKKVLLGCTKARCDAVYGAIRHLQAGVAAVARFPWTWEEDDPSARFVQLHSAPLMVPVQIDSFLSATVLS